MQQLYIGREISQTLAWCVFRGGITGYPSGLPEELYALFGTGYLGYTAARQWGKAKGTEG